MTNKISELRKQAEEKASHLPENLEAMHGDTLRQGVPIITQTLHELRVHQIELEMQNTALSQRQEELDAARARYFDLYELAPVGYITLSKQGLIIEANLTAATMLGMVRGGPGYAHPIFSQFIHIEDQDISYRFRKQLLETPATLRQGPVSAAQAGEPQVCELRMVKKDGTEFWARLEANAEQDHAPIPGRASDGAPVCRIVLTDVTERKRFEEVQAFLAQTSSGKLDEPFFEALARYLARNLGMDYVCIDRLEGDELTARTLAVWCDGHFEDNVTYALKDTPCGNVVGQAVCCFPASVCQFFPRDQALQDLRAESYVGVTLFDHTGRPIGLIAVIGRKPLSNRPLAEAILQRVAGRAAGELERLAAEEALRESETRLNKAQQIAHVGSWELDILTNRLIWSDEIYRIFGLQPQEFGATYEAFLDAIHPDDRAAVDAAYSSSLREGRDSYEIEHRVVRKHTNDVRYVHERCEHVRDASGRIVRSVGMVHDITARKQMEEELLRAQKLESLGVLAGGIAHDFNNLLGVVQGYMDLVLTDLPPGHVSRQLLLTAMQSVSQTKDLTSRLITFSKGGGPIKEIFDVAAIIREAVQRTVKGTKVRVNFDFREALWPAEVDDLQMKQVFNHLTKNAVEAAPEGGILTIQAENALLPSGGVLDLQAGAYLKITFTDEGIGIHEEHLAKIFDPYFSTKSLAAQNGLGLGLAVCYSVLKSHDGHITVQSLPGKGASFVLYIPARPELAKGKDIKKTTSTAPRVGPVRVLIMDDDPQARELMRAYLERMDYEVTDVQHGQEAIDAYRKALESDTPFDLALLDLKVRQGMGGDIALKRLLAIAPTIKAILVSGYVDDPVMLNYADHGFQGALRKPFTREEMKSLVEKVLHE
ncbi:MAG: PAS domain-containing protein [Syntrophales bacterium]